MARDDAWWAQASDEQKAKRDAKEEVKADAWMAEREALYTDDPRDKMTAAEAAQYTKDHSVEGSLEWHLADAEVERDIWCTLDQAVLKEQARQAKMRKKYGSRWSGRVKIRRFGYEENAARWKRNQWDTVRWLEKRGFVTVGNGYVTWVGATE